MLIDSSSLPTTEAPSLHSIRSLAGQLRRHNPQHSVRFFSSAPMSTAEQGAAADGVIVVPQPSPEAWAAAFEAALIQQAKLATRGMNRFLFRPFSRLVMDE